MSVFVSSRLVRNHLQAAYSLRLLGKAMFFLVGNKCNRVKGHGIIYTNDVIKKLIYNIKNVRKNVRCIGNIQRRPFALLHLLLGNNCNRVKGHGII